MVIRRAFLHHLSRARPLVRSLLRLTTYFTKQLWEVCYFPILQAGKLRGNLALDYLVSSHAWNSGKTDYSQPVQ
jgi:hypothetical protein